MKVLIVCSGNSNSTPRSFKRQRPFIYEQIVSLCLLGMDVRLFLIRGKGVSGYLANLSQLKYEIVRNSIDIVHAHYGLSGLLCTMQHYVPVVTTYHGSDINRPINNLLSTFCYIMSSHNLFVSERLKRRIYNVFSKNYTIIPCGVDLKLFYPIDKKKARSRLGWLNNKKYILFSGCFNNKVKNYILARKAAKFAKHCEIVELKGFSREEVCLALNATDILLMTSFSEGSPQVIKEAMACNCPIVSTDVGDVKKIIKNTQGCYITSFEINDVASKIQMALDFDKRTNGRDHIKHLEVGRIAKNIFSIYEQVLNNS